MGAVQYLDRSLSRSDFDLLIGFLDLRAERSFIFEHRGRALCIKLILSLGLRSDEFVKVRVGDLDLNEFKIHIEGSKDSDPMFMKLGPKLSGQLSKAIAEYQLLYRPEDLKAMPLWRLCFGTKAYQSQTVKRELRDVWAKLRFECFGEKNRNVSLHGLRHSFAYRLLDGGLSLAHVQQALRHRSINSTMYYLAAKARSEVASKVADIIG